MIVAKTIFEFAAVVLLIYGFIHEKEVIRFEKWLKIKILRAILGVMKWENYYLHNIQIIRMLAIDIEDMGIIERRD